MKYRAIFLFIIAIIVTAPFSVAADKGEANTVADHGVDIFTDYDFDYDLGFLWLDKVAVANFKLQESNTPDVYIASLSAKTVGLAAKLTGNRQQRYVSMMQLMPDGSFRSMRHTSQKFKNGIDRTKVYLFNYDKREVTYQYFKNNKHISEEVIEIEGGGTPGDILTIFFNLVAGAYGPLEVGAHYEVSAFDRDGLGTIQIDFLPSAQRPKKHFFAEELLMCKVVVDQEVFDTKDGVIYIGYNEKRRPDRGVVTDIIGMGDVRGVMK